LSPALYSTGYHSLHVKRGYVDEAKHWRYSSARDYEGNEGLIAIERLWFGLW